MGVQQLLLLGVEEGRGGGMWAATHHLQPQGHGEVLVGHLCQVWLVLAEENNASATAFMWDIGVAGAIDFCLDGNSGQSRLALLCHAVKQRSMR